MMERLRHEAHPNRDWKPLDQLESSPNLKIPDST
jgi:hypothetical protein